MKKVFLVATAAFLFAGVSLADSGKHKGKKCCSKGSKSCCSKSSKSCCKGKSKTAKL